MRASWCLCALALGLAACASSPVAQIAPPAADTQAAAATPTRRPPPVFATVAPSATINPQATPTVHAGHTVNTGPTATPVWAGQGEAVTVDLWSFAFWPTRMIARVGDTITLKLRNLDPNTAHVFEIRDLGVFVAVGPGEDKAVTFTVKMPGVYEYICPIGGHAAAGMTGELLIEPEEDDD